MDLMKEELTKTNNLQVLYDALDHEDEEIREIAARRVGFSRDPTGVSVLINHLTEPNQNVRSEIIRALDRLGAPAEIALLSVLNKDPNPALYASAVEALRHFGTKVAIEALCNAVKSDDPRVRRAAIVSLEKIGMVNQEIENVLIKCLGDSESEVVQTSIRAIGTLGCDRAVPCLLEFINNSDEGVRYSSIFALGILRNTHAVIPLIKLMQSTDDYHFQIQIVNALAYIKDPLATEPLIEMLVEEVNNPMGRSRGLYRKSSQIQHCLAAIGEPVVQPLIDLIQRKSAKMLKSDIQEMRSCRYNPIFSDIRLVFADIRGSAVVAALIDLLENDNWVSRSWACTTLGDISHQMAITPLISIVIKDPSRDVRVEAGRALQNYPAGDVFDSLLREIKKSEAPDLDEAKWVIECIVKNSIGKLSERLFCEDTVNRSSTESMYRNVIACSAAISENEDLDNSFYGRRTGIRRMRRCRFPA
ncbi:MAG: HEAT repeat domain-containing protein [Methanoregula sp.]|nr:HEAT repeat domain-containing protein [Methanoregula sp.]